MNGRIFLTGLLIFGFVLFVGCAKHEHPAEAEHPAEGKENTAEGAKGKEEHPVDQPVTKALTKEELAEAIEDYVSEDANLKGGFFLVYDHEADTTLALTLELVHKARLSRIAADVYFACADFKTPEGKTYDLDIFMKGTTKDNLQVTEVIVHKEEGEPRYTWHEEGGIWKKKYAEVKKEEPKEPEHPVSEQPASEHPEHPE